MKKIFLILSTFACFSLQAEHCSLSIAPQGAYIRVRENSFANGPETRQDGVMYGGRALFEYKEFEALYSAVFASWFYGKPDGDSVKRRINTVDGEGRFGINFQALQGEYLLVTPYIGFGMFYSSEKRTPGLLNNKFYYYTYYIPVGLILDLTATEYFHWQFHFQWRPDIDPTVKGNTFPGQRFTNGKKENQFLVEMPFSFRFGYMRSWDISLIPFWKLVKHGSSTISPSIRYMYWGGSFSVGYHF